MPSSPRPPLVLLTAAAGLAGAVLTLLGDTSPYAGWLTLLFLLTAPALATWPLLPRRSPLARAIVAGSMTIVVNVAVAQVMLSLNLWSIRGGVAAVLAICLLLAMLDVVLTRRTADAGPIDDRPEEEDWIYEG
ncbi:hypothetical protein [Thermomonospora cellulosilytica]|uniref:Branched-subunit amino acid ABC-type transport system permease component n=1 Tax=Thermomonospora cellulosilytica TaxID=1411118 RepID=A0A7W3RC13_9ACTN|nr:hypothetical protein [Thermomonospora cellulosilytica]MBA9007364.1 branched-subunit amino acid ABC-type transport system permease component [Thermomonospora cellulosilytica]